MRPFSTLVPNQLWSEFFCVESVLYMKTQIEPFFPALFSSCIDWTNPRYLFGWGLAAIGGKTQHRGSIATISQTLKWLSISLKKVCKFPFNRVPNALIPLNSFHKLHSSDQRRPVMILLWNQRIPCWIPCVWGWGRSEFADHLLHEWLVCYHT